MTQYTVTWHLKAVCTSKRRKSLLSLGICEFSRGVAFIAAYDPHAPISREALKTQIVRDITIDDDGECSDSAWCLNLDCPKNHASLEHLPWIKSRRHLETLHSNLERIRAEMNMTTKKHGVAVYYEKPRFYRVNKLK